MISLENGLFQFERTLSLNYTLCVVPNMNGETDQFHN